MLSANFCPVPRQYDGLIITSIGKTIDCRNLLKALPIWPILFVDTATYTALRAESSRYQHLYDKVDNKWLMEIRQLFITIREHPMPHQDDKGTWKTLHFGGKTTWCDAANKGQFKFDVFEAEQAYRKCMADILVGKEDEDKNDE